MMVICGTCDDEEAAHKEKNKGVKKLTKPVKDAVKVLVSRHKKRKEVRLARLKK